MKTLFIPIFALAIVACSNPPETQTDTTEPVQSMENQDKAQNDNAKEQAPAHLIYVRMETSAGDVVIELDSTNAPQTVNNFLSYVDEGFYDGTIFHRVIDNFMIQGGGFSPGGAQKPTKDPIFLESQNGLTNDVGTVAMARTQSPNSATAQFFINLKDNDFLNYAPGNPGYAVFGRVASGMEVVNEIRKVKTGGFEQFRDWPLEDVVIKSIKRE